MRGTENQRTAWGNLEAALGEPWRTLGRTSKKPWGNLLQNISAAQGGSAPGNRRGGKQLYPKPLLWLKTANVLTYPPTGFQNKLDDLLVSASQFPWAS